mmetsp:Transcript_21966/g.70995  ORF Transcript_21966/g.70995 Transcript_21966/m.70995 type:complete len:303 (+) Transcript_21966:655-1563(+)
MRSRVKKLSAGDKDTVREDAFIVLDLNPVREALVPVVNVLFGESLRLHRLAVLVNLLHHVREVALHRRGVVKPADVLEPGALDKVEVHGRAAHKGGGVAVREGGEVRLRRAVGAHEVGEDEHAPGLEDALHLREERRLVARVAEHLAAPHKVKLVGPFRGERVVQVAHHHLHPVRNPEALAFRHVHLVLLRPEVEPLCLATKLGHHGVRATSVAGAEVEHKRVLGHRLRPVHERHHELSRRRGALLHAPRRVAITAKVNVVTAAAHDALVEDAGVFLVVLLEDLVGDLVLRELLSNKVGHGV